MCLCEVPLKFSVKKERIDKFHLLNLEPDFKANGPETCIRIFLLVITALLLKQKSVIFFW